MRGWCLDLVFPALGGLHGGDEEVRMCGMQRLGLHNSLSTWSCSTLAFDGMALTRRLGFRYALVRVMAREFAMKSNEVVGDQDGS